MLFAGVQGCDLVFLHGQRAVVSGVCFSRDQGPGLVEGARGEDRVREGDEAYTRGGGIGGEAQQTCGGDEESGGCAGEGVGADIAFGGVISRGVGADPGDAVEGGAADLPARRVEFEADEAAAVVDGEVDGTGGGGFPGGVPGPCAGRGGELGYVAPAGGAGRAVEPFFGEGVWSCGSWSEYRPRGMVARVLDRGQAPAGEGEGLLTTVV